jgi:hypothetical protein
VLTEVALCRTPLLGSHGLLCEHCGELHGHAYNSCGNRHCPSCKGRARAAWRAARRREALPVPYFHSTFTLPHELAPLAEVNFRVVYNLLFHAASQTIQQIAANPKHLGGRVGMIGAVHTWGGALVHHPHVHFLIPGIALTDDGRLLRPKKGDYFLPDRVLSSKFRGKFLALLDKARQKGELKFVGPAETLAAERAWQALKNKLYQKNWVVHTSPPAKRAGGVDQLLGYLARYVDRVAITDDRLLSLADGQVTFRYKRHHGDRVQWKTTSLDATTFLDRFLSHVVPAGFHRFRQFGLLANCHRQKNLARLRQLLDVPARPVGDGMRLWVFLVLVSLMIPTRCPGCRKGDLVHYKEDPPRWEDLRRLPWRDLPRAEQLQLDCLPPPEPLPYADRSLVNAWWDTS